MPSTAVTPLDNSVFMDKTGVRSTPTERHSESNLWDTVALSPSSGLNNSQAILLIAESAKQTKQKSG